jgi:hypothetical protein
MTSPILWLNDENHGPLHREISGLDFSDSGIVKLCAKTAIINPPMIGTT